MAKEIDVSCNFVRKQLVCKLPNQTMDVVLKVRMKTGEHTFWKDVYARTLNNYMWSDPNKPFLSLKKRIADIFRKKSDSDSSHS